MSKEAEPRQACGWCATGDHLGCVKGRNITGPCGCTVHPGACGGDVR